MSRASYSKMGSSKVAEKEHRFTVEAALKTLLAGGVAGMVAKTAVAPLDRIKILLQAQNRHYKHLGVYSGLSEIARREGVLAFFRGNGAQMVRIFPYSALQFGSFEFYKKQFPTWLNINPSSHGLKFVAGASAGCTAVTFTFPLDTIRARLAFQTDCDKRYKGIIHTATAVFREEGGIRGLYRGIVPTILGMIPYAGLSFYSFELLKFLCISKFTTWTCREDSIEGTQVLTIPFKLLCGGISGAMAQTFSYPLDVARRRMQLAMLHPETEKFAIGTWSSLVHIYKEDGITHGLYRGLSITYLRAIPMVALSFATYEVIKQGLHLDTGLKISSG